MVFLVRVFAQDSVPIPQGGLVQPMQKEIREAQTGTREAAILAEGGKEVKEAEATEATAAKDNKEGKNADGASRNSVDGALGPVDILEALLNGGSGLRPSRAGG